MQVNFKFEPGQAVVEKSTGITGTIDTCGIDQVGTTYMIRFDVRTHGRRLHWKREVEIKLAPKTKTK